MTSPSTSVVTKSRSPQITGDEWPRPSTSTFQATFELGLQVVGKPLAEESPLDEEPRHPVQSFGPAWTERARAGMRRKRESMRDLSFSVNRVLPQTAAGVRSFTRVTKNDGAGR